MTSNFNVVEYLGSLIGYPIPLKAVERIATERGLINVTDWTDISRRDRNLVIADMLMVLFTSPSNTGSKTRSHGDFSVTIGGTIITDKNDIYSLMMKLYENPDAEIWENLKDVGGCQWMD
jgi:hypothetical protein